MHVKKSLVTVVLTGLLTVTSFSGVLAAGLGVVDFQYLEQHHPDFNKAVAAYQADIKQYRGEYTKQSKNFTDQQKKDAIASYNQKLNAQRISLFGPIDKSIIDSVNKVKTDKGLDYVAVKGYVVSGDSTDITSDVAHQLGEQ